MMTDEELAGIRQHYSGTWDHMPVGSTMRAIHQLLDEIERLKGTLPPLPYVKPLKSSHECRVCRRWLEGEWSRAAPEQQDELQRQMNVGRCDNCTRMAAREAQRV